MTSRSSLAAFSLALILSAAGCAPDEDQTPKQGDKQAAQYEMLARNSPTAAALCEKARNVTEAYLADGNEQKFQEWKLTEGNQCRLAESVENVRKAFENADSAVGDFMQGN